MGDMRGPVDKDFFKVCDERLERILQLEADLAEARRERDEALVRECVHVEAAQAAEAEVERVKGFLERLDYWMLETAKTLGWEHDDWNGQDPALTQSLAASVVADLAEARLERDEALRKWMEPTHYTVGSDIYDKWKAAEAENARLKVAITHVVCDSPGTPETVKDYLREALRASGGSSTDGGNDG